MEEMEENGNWMGILVYATPAAVWRSQNWVEVKEKGRFYALCTFWTERREMGKPKGKCVGWMFWKGNELGNQGTFY